MIEDDWAKCTNQSRNTALPKAGEDRQVNSSTIKLATGFSEGRITEPRHWLTLIGQSRYDRQGLSA